MLSKIYFDEIKISLDVISVDSYKDYMNIALHHPTQESPC